MNSTDNKDNRRRADAGTPATQDPPALPPRPPLLPVPPRLLFILALVGCVVLWLLAELEVVRR